MIYVVAAAVLSLCALLTLAPLRAGAVCTRATHRARQAFGVVCALLCLHGIGLFVWFIVVKGHPVTANVVVGRVANAVFGVQAWLLLRSIFLRARYAIPLAMLCLALALAAIVHVAA